MDLVNGHYDSDDELKSVLTMDCKCGIMQLNEIGRKVGTQGTFHL